MARAIDCKTCLHEKVCDLWMQQKRQDANCFCLDGCDYFEPTLTPQNEWVSVEERLPENHAQVLMWSAKWNIAEAGSYYNGRFWVYSEIGDAYIADDITHWMSLPEPPDKGNNVLAKTPNEPLTCEGCDMQSEKVTPCASCIRDPRVCDYYTSRPSEKQEDNNDGD